MAGILSESQIADIIDAFNAVDDDRDGIIPSSKLGAVLKRLGENPTDADVQDMINDIDADGSGSIEFPSFLTMMAKKVSDLAMEDEIQEAFRIFDTDKNGLISRQELRSVMRNLGENLSDEECDGIVEEADRDGDGQINFEEFHDMMVSFARAAS